LTSFQIATPCLPEVAGRQSPGKKTDGESMTQAEKIRVLIVDDITETRENIRRMLQFDANIEIAGTARTGKEAVQMAQQLKPDVIVMDINMPDMDGIAATQEIKKKASYIEVVILSVQYDQSYFRRAMGAGARDFLTKPPMIDELTDAVRKAGKFAHENKKKDIPVPVPVPSSQGRIIVVYSPKGGTGRTTIAVNLAIALRTSEETKVAVVDGNLRYGDVVAFFSEQAKTTVSDLAPNADELDDDFIRSVVVSNRASGVDILAAPPRPEMADQITGEQFSKILTYLKRIYTYIIVDSTSELTEAVQGAIEVADLTVLITTQDIPAIKDANLFLVLADALGIRRDNIMFIMNKFDKQIRIMPERIGQTLRQEVVSVVPFDYKIVTDSVNRGVPFMLDSGKTQPIGKSISQLADLVRERIAKLSQEAITD
jgi:pilus assembly protein CpaE